VFGVLNLNKPPGKTSRDVVNIVQRLAKPHKAGHAGTLDPIATGVLITCVGAATRLITYAQQLPKEYRATFRLGQSSASEDIESEVELLPDAPRPSQEQIQAVLPQFTGDILQTPPAFSALKVNGERAYKLARRGEEVQLKGRPISIYSIQLVRYEYPELVLDVQCGSGTYIRSLGRDIARALQTEAVMSALCRTAIGPFRVADALTPAELCIEKLSHQLQPANSLLAALPAVVLNPNEIDQISTGRSIRNRFELTEAEIVAESAAGEVLAILKHRQDGSLAPKINFITRH
jgi:tRNA pseudouridine55 synthase